MTLSQLALSFKGRARRRHWWATLIAISIFYWMMEVVSEDPPSLPFITWALIVQAITTWVFFAVSAKRWHDIGKSGWWSGILLLPLVGWLIVLFFNGLVGGHPRDNEYGAPLE